MMNRVLLVIALLFLVPGPWSPVPAIAEGTYFTGVRACGVDNIGPLQDTDCISVDRWDVSKGFQTTPGDLYDYLLERMSGVVAPAAHAHDVATETMNGFLLNEDKIRIDALPVTVKGEGALGTNTYTTLTAAGYTVASAQARWPYLTSNGALNGTHLIQSTGDLDNYDVNWCAMQAALYKAAGGLVFVNNGGYPIGRALTVPSGTVLAGYSLNAVIYPHTVWTGDKRLVVLPVGSVETKIYGLKFNENPWPAMNGGQFYGIYVNSGSYRVRITECSGNALAKLVFVDKSSDQIKIAGNACNDVAQEVWFSKGTTDHWHHMLLVDDNDFMHSYRSGMTYAVMFEDNAQAHYFRVTNNRVSYQSLFRYYNVLTTVSGTAMFSEISRNRVIGNVNAHIPIIYWVGNVEYTSKMADNFLWGPEHLIAIGGQKGLSITGVTGLDGSLHTTCVVRLLAPVGQVLVSGIASLQQSNLASVCGSYSLAGTGNLSNATTYSLVNLAGSAMGASSELRYDQMTTDYLRFVGNVNKTATYNTSEVIPPDIGTVVSYGSNIQLSLPKPTMLAPGKRILLWNNSSTQLTVAGNGLNFFGITGDYVSSVTVGSYSTAEFLVITSNGIWLDWRQIQ